MWAAAENAAAAIETSTALHTVAVTRMRCHPETRHYEASRTALGKSRRDIRRTLKRALARRFYRRIEATVRRAILAIDA